MEKLPDSVPEETQLSKIPPSLPKDKDSLGILGTFLNARDRGAFAATSRQGNQISKHATKLETRQVSAFVDNFEKRLRQLSSEEDGALKGSLIEVRGGLLHPVDDMKRQLLHIKDTVGEHFESFVRQKMRENISQQEMQKIFDLTKEAVLFFRPFGINLVKPALLNELADWLCEKKYFDQLAQIIPFLDENKKASICRILSDSNNFPQAISIAVTLQQPEKSNTLFDIGYKLLGNKDLKAAMDVAKMTEGSLQDTLAMYISNEFYDNQSYQEALDFWKTLPEGPIKNRELQYISVFYSWGHHADFDKAMEVALLLKEPSKSKCLDALCNKIIWKDEPERTTELRIICLHQIKENNLPEARKVVELIKDKSVKKELLDEIERKKQ